MTSGQDLSLLEVLSNHLVLYRTVVYLPISSLLALGASSRSFQNLIHHTHGVFRHIDLSEVKSIQFDIAPIDHGGEVWRNVQMDENVTEDDFYAGPLRGVFANLHRRNILKDVTTLVLDGLSVTSELISEIILHPSFNVRILSIREVRNLNERKLMQALEYSVRPSRPANMPKLQALYIFGPKDSPRIRQGKRKPNNHPPRIASSDTGHFVGGVMSSQGARIGAEWNQKSEEELSKSLTQEGDKWWGSQGKLIGKNPTTGWAETMISCKGLIFFDAILCNGPRHDPLVRSHVPPKNELYLPPTVATFSVGGCQTCKGAPEGWSIYQTAPLDSTPLLSPVSIHSSTIKEATRPSHRSDGLPCRLLARCQACLQNRYCQSCQKFWCEDCYDISSQYRAPSWQTTASSATIGSQTAQQGGAETKTIKLGVLRSCWECGMNCAECVEKKTRFCTLCGGGYCITHFDGSTLTTCDWCARSGRRTRGMY